MMRLFLSLAVFCVFQNKFFFSFEFQEVEDSETGDVLPKATKKKPPKIEENKSKKEHVNVVFIGHVGEFILVFSLHIFNYGKKRSFTILK